MDPAAGDDVMLPEGTLIRNPHRSGEADAFDVCPNYQRAADQVALDSDIHRHSRRWIPFYHFL